MSRNYDNWEKLVAAVIKKQQLLGLFHAHSRNPSDLSDASDFSSIFEFEDFPFGHSISVNNQALIIISDYDPVFGLKDLLRGSPEILGKGTFGSVCAFKLDNGITVVVKSLNMVNDISEQDFKTHMGIIGDVEHENVATLRAYYYSKDEKLLIYDYYSDRSVFPLLHGKQEEYRAKLDWKVLVRIAIGAARGISHIHTQNGGKLVHGNIKSSNIFVNSEGYGLVSDHGLASMVQTTFPQSSRCYAPEVKSTPDVSQASDVYSFGILLLELLTRKSSHPSLGHQDVGLVQLVNSVSRHEWNMNVFDGDLLLTPSIWKQIVRMLEIAISCLAKSPYKRPKMSEVAKMIEEIGMVDIRNHDSVKSKSMMNTGTHDSIKSESMMNMGTQGSIKSESVMNMANHNSIQSEKMLDSGNLVSQTERNNLVFVGGSYLAFDHEDLLRASDEFLGNGTFGTSYKATLEYGIIVYVKRLKDVTVTNEEFQQHVEVTGRIEHKNVAEVKAYYYSRDEKLLVYHHYSQGSLSTRLHGSRDSGKRPMKWTTRLKIAVDAARGVAHIHTKNGQELVHGNIRASNILLYNQQFGIVSDVGLGKLVSPKTFLGTCNAGYCAPEVTDSRKVSQASDVYSFGVVLLELFSGQLPQTTYKSEVMSLVREDWASQVFDVELSRYEDVEEEMVGVMQVAMHCVARLPERRPKMNEVVKMLEKIAGL